jgi:DMSO/TMAO reductase YedYZ molybdopterin-dependent catalytic subunit
VLLTLGGAASLVATCTPAPQAPSKPTAAPAATPAAKAEVKAPPQVKPVPAELFINYGSNHEMRWHRMADKGYAVPNEQFFIRSHTRTPAIDAATWRLKVEGPGVEAPLELSYDELQKLPSVTLDRYVECAGNGRSFFETIGGQKAEGTQWKLGAIGVAEWTGVPLKELLQRAKVTSSARDVMPEGLDELRVRRPMAIDKAMEDDTLLAYAMNGQPLPPDHGFPVRMLVPGWIGVASIKWVGRIEVSDQPLQAPWNTDSYVLIGPDYEPKPPAKGPVLSTQNVKSALELDWPAELKAGPQKIRGRSWSPFGKIAKLEYSVDGGKTFQTARLEEKNLARAWVRWEFDWDAKPGEHGIVVRATDDRADSQPERVPFNQQGYLYNGIVSHPVQVT